MKRLLVFAAVVVITVMYSGVLLAQSDPFVGTWKINRAKSKYTSGEPAKAGTMITIQRMGDQEQLTSTMPDGSPLKYEVPDKGGVGKFIAGPYDGVSEKRTDDNTRDITWMKGGKEMLHFHAVVSKDGKTMRITSKGTNAQGTPVSGVAVWEKQ